MKLRDCLLPLPRHFVGWLPPAGAGSGDPAYNDGSWKPHGSGSVAVVLSRGGEDLDEIQKWTGCLVQKKEAQKPAGRVPAVAPSAFLILVPAGLPRMCRTGDFSGALSAEDLADHAAGLYPRLPGQRLEPGSGLVAQTGRASGPGGGQDRRCPLWLAGCFGPQSHQSGSDARTAADPAHRPGHQPTLGNVEPVFLLALSLIH